MYTGYAFARKTKCKTKKRIYRINPRGLKRHTITLRTRTNRLQLKINSHHAQDSRHGSAIKDYFRCVLFLETHKYNRKSYISRALLNLTGIGVICETICSTIRNNNFFYNVVRYFKCDVVCACRIMIFALISETPSLKQKKTADVTGRRSQGEDFFFRLLLQTEIH